MHVFKYLFTLGRSSFFIGIYSLGISCREARTVIILLHVNNKAASVYPKILR